MRITLSFWAAGLALALAGTSGCHCFNKRRNPPLPAPAPCPCVPAVPRQVTGPPVAGRGFQEGVPQIPPQPVPVPVGPETRGGYEPPAVQQGSYYWTPAEASGVQLLDPVPYRAETPRKPAELPRRLPTAPEKTQGQEERDTSQGLPVGIPQFALARDKVSSGLKPSLDGLDWLKDGGYRTVLHVRRPGEDDSADRKQVVKRGMTFVSLEFTPATLEQKVIDEFNRIVGDIQGQPLFVYDSDGMLAGGLWYLHFRTVLKDSDETARLKATRLGLKEEAEEDHKAMWAAIKKYLNEPQGK